MAWALPEHDRQTVNRAGKLLVEGFNLLNMNDYESALTVINNWRASHSFPLNTFQMNLRLKAKSLDEDALIARRIKRLPSIRHKLQRFPNMKLSQMQDLGGCRAIVKDVNTVRELVRRYQASDVKHKVASSDDYIEKPKNSGYRGVHLVYRYFSDRKETYNGLKVEMQIRSQLQHSWATAVEVVGTLIQQALKSSQGEDEWLRFFQLMGSAIALEESCITIPETPNDRSAIIRELRSLAKALRPIQRLQQYSHAIQVVGNASKKSRYYLIALRPSERRVEITGFTEKSNKAASDAYLDIEQSLSSLNGDEAVLVSVDSIDSLKRAYPNYFLDTSLFLKIVRRWITA